jgi:hypothetical protein
MKLNRKDESKAAEKVSVVERPTWLVRQSRALSEDLVICWLCILDLDLVMFGIRTPHECSHSVRDVAQGFVEHVYIVIIITFSLNISHARCRDNAKFACALKFPRQLKLSCVTGQMRVMRRATDVIG